jgi:hypothetical protein
LHLGHDGIDDGGLIWVWIATATLSTRIKAIRFINYQYLSRCGFQDRFGIFFRLS